MTCPGLFGKVTVLYKLFLEFILIIFFLLGTLGFFLWRD